MDKWSMGSRETARAAAKMSLTDTREEEKALKEEFSVKDILCVAVDMSGEYISSMMEMVSRAIVASKREKVIKECLLEEGAVAGATKEAISQIMSKAIGCNIGGKIGIARSGEHISVCVFAKIGLLHLNEVAMGLGHRVL
ncbi:MAG: HutP family protein [Clostridia bacterium]